MEKVLWTLAVFGGLIACTDAMMWKVPRYNAMMNPGKDWGKYEKKSGFSIDYAKKYAHENGYLSFFFCNTENTMGRYGVLPRFTIVFFTFSGIPGSLKSKRGCKYYERKEDVNECGFDWNKCGSNAECSYSPGRFTCKCKSGFIGDGRTCIDIDECSLRIDNCDMNAACTNTPGLFSCQCKPGFIGDGTFCADMLVWEKVGNAAMPSRYEWGNYRTHDGMNIVNSKMFAETREYKSFFICDRSNTFGRYGFVPADTAVFFPFVHYSLASARGCNYYRRSPDVDECVRNTHNCDVNARCINTPGTFTCRCKDGFQGDGVVCTSMEEANNGKKWHSLDSLAGGCNEHGL